MQTLCISFRDEGVGGPQGEGEFGYGNGWMSTGDFSMVTIIGLCVNSGMKTLPVTLVSSVCHPKCSKSLWTGWVHESPKQDTPYRKALEPGLKLAMTMRKLASGDRYASMKFDFRVPHNTMSVCVVKCARPSSRSARTSASSVLPPKQNGGSFLRHLDEDGTCPMHAPRLMGNM